MPRVFNGTLPPVKGHYHSRLMLVSPTNSTWLLGCNGIREDWCNQIEEDCNHVNITHSSVLEGDLELATH